MTRCYAFQIQPSIIEKGNSMLIGIVGLPYTGKTTVFNALTGLSAPTGKYSDAQGEINRGVVSVPDERLDRLAEMYKPKKVTHATIEFCDVAGFRKGASSDASVSSYLLGQLRDMDALAMTVRVFERDSVPHPENRIDPVADLDTLLTANAVGAPCEQRFTSGHRASDDCKERSSSHT